MACAGRKRVQLIGDILQEDFKVIYLVPYEEGYQSLKDTEYFCQFRINEKFFYYLSNVNVLLLLKIRQCIKKYHVKSLWFSQPYGIIMARIFFPTLPIIYLSHDFLGETINITSPAIKKSFFLLRLFPTVSLKYAMKSFFLITDKISCALSDFVLTQSNDDRAKFIQLFKLPPQKIISAPCPLDSSLKTNLKRTRLSNKRLTVVFHGSYSYPPNKDAVNFILTHLSPYLKEHAPNVLFLIAGADMPNLEGPNYKGIGFVADLNDFLSRADIAIIPLTQGTGLRTKALDYMASGIPVISTKIGVGGISVESGVHVILVENLSEMAQAIVGLSRNQAKRNELAANALQLVMANYSRAAIKEKLMLVT